MFWRFCRSWKPAIAVMVAWRGVPDALCPIHGLGIIRDISGRLRCGRHHGLDVHAGRVVSRALKTQLDTA